MHNPITFPRTTRLPCRNSGFPKSRVVSCTDIIRIGRRIVLVVDPNVCLAIPRTALVAHSDAVRIIKAVAHTGIKIGGVRQLADIPVGPALRARVLSEFDIAIVGVADDSCCLGADGRRGCRGGQDGAGGCDSAVGHGRGYCR